MITFAQQTHPLIIKFIDEEGYFLDDNQCRSFFKANPENTDVQVIIEKISAMEHEDIDRLIHSRLLLANHIAGLQIDKDLKTGNPQIVEYIAHLSVKNQPYFLYSFASRYCNWHDPEAYPVYDPGIHQLLSLFFSRIKKEAILNDEFLHYRRYKELLDIFRLEMGLGKLNYKELDKFVWVYHRALENMISETQVE